MTTQAQAPHFIPTYAVNLKDNTGEGQIRLGLQSLQGLGKTFAALTFPNPVVLDFDNNTLAHRGRGDIYSIEFWNDDFINNVMKVPNDTHKRQFLPDRRPNRRDALKKFLHENIGKFSPSQTLILDSWSTVQNAFDIQTTAEPKYNVKGEIDGYAFWSDKAEYSVELVELLKTAKCNVVVTVHETFERDKDDRIIGISPLMSGKAFKDQFSAHFSDWFRVKFMLFESSDTNRKLSKDEKELVMSEQFRDKVVSKDGSGAYVFQAFKDDLALSIKTHLRNIPVGCKYIPAHYNVFTLFR